MGVGRALKRSNYLNRVEANLVLTVRVYYNALPFGVVERWRVGENCGRGDLAANSCGVNNLLQGNHEWTVVHTLTYCHYILVERLEWSGEDPVLAGICDRDI